MPKLSFRFACSFLTCLLALSLPASAQMGMGGPQTPAVEYVIGEIKVSGTEYLDAQLLETVTGLNVGDKFKLENDPAVSKAIRNMWGQQLFSDIRVNINKIEGNKVFLEFIIKERPRLGQLVFKNLNKTQETEIKDKLNMVTHRMVTPALKKDIDAVIKKYFREKGYNNTQIRLSERRDTSAVNTIVLTVDVDKGKKVHINQINFVGNDHVMDTRLKGKLKGTKEMPRISLYPADKYSIYGQEHYTLSQYLGDLGFLSPSKTLELLNPYFRWNFFSGSKFNQSKYEEDKNKLLAYYNTLGYRDAQVVNDTIYTAPDGNLNIEMQVAEGKKYYFGDIEWRGNTKHSDSLLSRILNIKRGDVFNQEHFDNRLGSIPSPEGMDIGSLYMDDGYLFFRVNPIEKSIVGDTINYEIQIMEGPQATIKDITISGNDRTNDHVLRRELYTLPGAKFSRSDIIRSIRQVSNLGFIDPEKVNPIPKPNMADGTVDIDYNVAEKSSDQLELSAGYGNGMFMGTVGISFNNFSLNNFFKFKEWDPLPMGDGQKLSIRYQSNGKWFNSANLSFTEPWLGGRKPTALSVNLMYGRQAYGDGSSISYLDGDPTQHYLTYWGGGVSLSKRLRWPDDNFVFSYGLNFQQYRLKDYALGIENFTNGTSNNLFFRLTLARNSVDQPIYPRSGANINFSFQFTPPYSLFEDRDITNETDEERYKWIEYHKYRFTAEWYQRIAGNLVFKFAAKYGFLGYYNKSLGYSPFERFSVGGDGLSGFNAFVGKDIISHRGYETGYEGMVSPTITNATIFNKYTAEIRYPFSLNPSATIFGLAFFEAANGWNSFKEYNPFQLYRSTGVGVRIYLPMFGLLGLDYGVGLDRLGNGTKFGDAARFTFMLGFEPD